MTIKMPPPVKDSPAASALYSLLTKFYENIDDTTEDMSKESRVAWGLSISGIEDVYDDINDEYLQEDRRVAGLQAYISMKEAELKYLNPLGTIAQNMKLDAIKTLLEGLEK